MIIPMAERPIGLIAGGGALPELTAAGIRAAGREVVCAGLAGQYEDGLPGMCDRFKAVGLVRIGQWMRTLRRWGAQEAVMIGMVRKQRMYEPLALVRQVPDLHAAKVWLWDLRHSKQSQTLLGAVADELARGGVKLIDTTRYLPEHLADEGVMTAKPLSAKVQADIDFGWPVLMRMNELQVGQAVAVKGGDVIAVEAIEGTDAMILRAGELCRSGGWTLLKAPDERKDMRFDVPTIGVQTIENLRQAKAAAVVVKAGRVIMAEKPKVIDAANAAGIAVVGV